MDNLEQNQNPSSWSNQTSKSSWGPAIGLIIILVLIIAGSFYFFRESNRLAYPVSPGASVADIEDELLELQTQSDSDELSAIEADLEATELGNMDAELSLMEQELSQLEAEF